MALHSSQQFASLDATTTRQHTLTLTGEMAAVVAHVAVIAPRGVRPKACASRIIRATAFKGARVSASPKVRVVCERREKKEKKARSIFFVPRFFSQHR